MLAASAIKKEVTDYKRKETKTYGNIYGYHFNVPTKVYSDEKYREKLGTLEGVERIIRDYRKHHKTKE